MTGGAWTKPFRAIIKLPIQAYRLLISPVLGPRCRYYPTCSAYALQAIDRHGVLKGIALTAKRLLRCHPLAGHGGIDEVPEAFAWRELLRYKGHQDNTKKKTETLL